MQEINTYLQVNGAAAVLVDQYNQPTSSSATPKITRGVKCNWNLILLAPDGTAYPAEQLTGLAFQLVLAEDWKDETPPLVHVTAGITVSANKITIPVIDTNTPEIAAYVSGSASKAIGAECAGYVTGEDSPSFLIQFDAAIGNRRYVPEVEEVP